MKKEEKFGIFLFALILAFLLACGAAYVVKNGYPSGSDITLHTRLSEGWRDFEFPVFNEKYFSKGLFPYPPAFHVTLAVLSLLTLTDVVTIANILQVLLFPAILFSTFYLVYKKADIYSATLGVLLLAASPAFWDRGAQVIPQAVDLLLLPLAVYFFLEGRSGIFIVISGYLVYSHWLYAALPLSSLLFYSALYKKERLKDFAKIFLICLPFILLMLAYAPAMFGGEGFLAGQGGINEPQELGVREEPLFAIKYLGYPLFLLAIASAIHLKFKSWSEVEKIAVLWVITLIPMIIFFPDRFIEYVAQPIAILGALTLSDLVKSEKARILLVAILFFFALASDFAFYEALITRGEVLMPLDTLLPFVK